MTTQASIFRALLAAAVLVALQVGSASASEYPVLFIHGFCSNSGTWDGMFDNLSRRRFGDKLIQAYAAADGKVYARNGPLPTELRSFAIDFYDPGGQTFDKVAVANISISDKVRQLKTVIDGIKGATGAPKVVVVAHSMGGLVARAYVQGWGLTSSGRLVTYGDDVARVVTIDTPHQGSGLGSIPTDLTPWDRLCLTTATVNKSEMLPDSGFLHSINSERPWPSDTKMDAVASYYQNPPFPSAGDTDGVVTRESQDIRTVSSYWATNPNIQAYLQRLSVPRLPVLHTAVLGLNVTSSLVASLIAETDSDPPSSPSRCATTAISIGAVISGQLTTADCFAPHRSSQRGDLYSFNAVAGQRLHISMSAGSLDDPYLVLVGPTGAIVAEDDDSGPVDDPLIDVVAPTTGVYVVESTTYDSFSYEGAYLY